jgi:hypothetical protein
MPKKPAVVYLLAGADSQGRRLEAGKNYRLHVPNDMPVNQFWVLQRLRRIESSRDSQRLLCYLRDDLCDVFCIFIGGVVVELAPEAGIDYALLQAYIGTGGEVSSFPDGTCPKLVGAQLQRDELPFGRTDEMATICRLQVRGARGATDAMVTLPPAHNYATFCILPLSYQICRVPHRFGYLSCRFETSGIRGENENYLIFA